jgi:hypothetical protein
MAEIAAGAPISMEVVRALANKPGTLDLYLWQAWQVARGTAASVSICGAGGPCVMLPCASDRSRAEQEIRHHNALIRAAWPESPYEIAPDGKGLVYEPAAGAETAADSEMGADVGQATCGPGEHISGTAENHGSSGPAPPRAGVVGATARSDARPSVTAGLDARPGGRASSEPATGPPQAPVIDLAAAGLASATTGHRRTLRRRRRRKKRRKRSR